MSPNPLQLQNNSIDLLRRGISHAPDQRIQVFGAWLSGDVCLVALRATLRCRVASYEFADLTFELRELLYTGHEISPKLEHIRAKFSGLGSVIMVYLN